MTSIEVITINLTDENAPIARVVIDHDSRDQREWLGKHCYWAMRNAHSVKTSPMLSQKEG